jgi:hypothetical protein
MADNSNVNRRIEDPDMRQIYHALGRPLDPMQETYRDYFAECAGTIREGQMRASPHWDGGTTRGDLTYFHVTASGRAALAAYLKETGDRWRRYVIRWNGFDLDICERTRAKAMYAAFLRVSDSYDVTFGAFVRSARMAPHA